MKSVNIRQIWYLFMGVGLSMGVIFANDTALLQTLYSYVPSAQRHAKFLQRLVSSNTPETVALPQIPDREIYTAFPNLRATVPCVQLAHLPTPVQDISTLGKQLEVGQLLIKRHDLTGDGINFGGNKLPKLEFLLADALRNNAKTIIIFGCAGSNFVAAAACCAQRLGLKSIAMLKPQPIAQGVRRNLLLMHQYGAQIHHSPDIATRQHATLQAFVRNKYQVGDLPYVIPTGGSCPLGTVGYVNAAFELKKQIEQGLLQEPDYIYVPSGSKGTAAGLILGAKVAGLKSTIIPVCVEPEDKREYPQSMLNLIKNTNQLLHDADTSFPIIEISEADLPIVFDCGQEPYGMFSKEGVEAMKLLQDTEGIKLDGTYTSKAFSGLIKDARAGKLKDKKVLFWHTYCADDQVQVKHTDYAQLPKSVHSYFTGEIQPLDR
ncbi:MAG TPA: pyridoxal-phosphate dependent enzyme [Candidatus Babeliales bacterium]|nr:pyridoxal-phosphate dependent enzyme [Candidatus Babeliales bacterium]